MLLILKNDNNLKTYMPTTGSRPSASTNWYRKLLSSLNSSRVKSRLPTSWWWERRSPTRSYNSSSRRICNLSKTWACTCPEKLPSSNSWPPFPLLNCFNFRTTVLRFSKDCRVKRQQWEEWRNRWWQGCSRHLRRREHHRVCHKTCTL